jgi:hypothetical protein
LLHQLVSEVQYQAISLKNYTDKANLEKREGRGERRERYIFCLTFKNQAILMVPSPSHSVKLEWFYSSYTGIDRMETFTYKCALFCLA